MQARSAVQCRSACVNEAVSPAKSARAAIGLIVVKSVAKSLLILIRSGDMCRKCYALKLLRLFARIMFVELGPHSLAATLAAYLLCRGSHSSIPRFVAESRRLTTDNRQLIAFASTCIRLRC